MLFAFVPSPTLLSCALIAVGLAVSLWVRLTKADAVGGRRGFLLWCLQWGPFLGGAYGLWPKASGPLTDDRLRLLLTKNLLEDLPLTVKAVRTVYLDDQKPANENVGSNIQGVRTEVAKANPGEATSFGTQAPVGTVLSRAEAGVQALKAFIDDTDRTASLFKVEFFAGRPQTELDKVTELCIQARERVVKPLEVLLKMQQPLESRNFNFLLEEVSKLSKEFPH